MSPRCDLDLEGSDNNNKQSRMTLWLMMLHHHTKFGNKMFCDSENIIQTNIYWHLNLRCDLDLERSNPIFQQDTLAYDSVLSNQVWSQTDQQFGRYSRNNHILINKPSLWPWRWTQWTFFFCFFFFFAWHSGLWCCITMSGLVTKRSVVQEILSGKNIH